MENLVLISRQEPGFAVIDNFEELKQMLSQQLEVYNNIVYTEEGLKAAKADRAALNKLKKSIDERRKEIKKVYMQPYLVVEAQLKELIALIDEPIALMDAYINYEKEREKEIRRSEISEHYRSVSRVLGEFADAVFTSPAFYDSKWENKTTKAAEYRKQMEQKIATAAADIAMLRNSGGKHAAALTERYLQTLSMDDVLTYKATLEKADAAMGTVSEIADDDTVVGYKVLRLSGTRSQMLQILNQIELLGMDVEELEDGMPRDMEEITAPNFDSFVAFDIEHTGTYGAAAGDAPPAITEIGAVKVEDGRIVDRFSMLANPGRKILPHIARLTHITDAMVANEPPVGEVIRLFKAFVGDKVLVGHNIKNCDIPYICEAAKKEGIAFENGYFDTYRYAKTLKDSMGWKNVKLEYLSEQFGISQPDAHRAWCDAEANVGVYFKLKELN